jgi:hypothetical protein
MMERMVRMNMLELPRVVGADPALRELRAPQPGDA